MSRFVMSPYIEPAGDNSSSAAREEYGLDDIQHTYSPQQQRRQQVGGSAVSGAELVSASPAVESVAAGIRKRGNFIRDRAIDKATKSAWIMARLALVRGYNDKLEIKLEDSSGYLTGSNLINLVWHVLAPARQVSGLREFVRLMSDAGVEPDWIDNPNVRSALLALRANPTGDGDAQRPPDQQPPQASPQNALPPPPPPVSEQQQQVPQNQAPTPPPPPPTTEPTPPSTSSRRPSGADVPLPPSPGEPELGEEEEEEAPGEVQARPAKRPRLARQPRAASAAAAAATPFESSTDVMRGVTAAGSDRGRTKMTEAPVASGDATSDSLLASLYYAPHSPAALGGVERLWQEARRVRPWLTRNAVRDWLAAQNTYTRHKPSRRRFARNPIVVSRVDELWQADVAYLASNAMARANGGNKYLVVIVDAFSKQLYVRAMKRKDAPAMEGALRHVFESGAVPETLQTDLGREFNNGRVAALLRDHGVRQTFARNPAIKASLAENAIRTIKSRLYRHMDASKSSLYLDALQPIVNAHNDRTHSVTGVAPRHVTSRNSSQVFRRTYGFDSKREYLRAMNRRAASTRPKLRVGDRVRLAFEPSLMARARMFSVSLNF